MRRFRRSRPRHNREADAGVSASWRAIVGQFAQPESFRPDLGGIALARLSFAYDELVSQERYPIKRYDAVLAGLETRRGG